MKSPMDTSNVSVQSFYGKDVQTAPPVARISEPFKAGDGFTEDELASAMDPLRRAWDPEREYEQLGIAQLVPGPRAVTFVGRVVNLATRYGRSAKQPKARGWHFLLVKDDQAAISVKLYFAQKQYPIKLGQLLTFWTGFIADNTKNEAGAIEGVIINANMFPGRVTSDHIMIHTSNATYNICRIPLGYQENRELPGLMTVDAWLKGGHDGIRDVKLLVCVKSLGGSKKIAAKKEGASEHELMDVVVFDHTRDVKMTLWNELVESARDWVVGVTILLVSNPRYRVGTYGGKGNISIQRQSMIEVGPDFPHAEWLAKYVVGLMKKESIMLKVPEGVWDVRAAEYGVDRPLFTLAELDRWVRSDGRFSFTGYINVIIMDMSLVTLHRRNMLMCSTCCGILIYANNLTAPCRSCANPLSLSLNPHIIGTLADETGCIEQGKLLWSPQAWEQLFGRSVDIIAALSIDEARWFEERMMFLRMHLVVGWEENIGRLTVLAMKM